MPQEKSYSSPTMAEIEEWDAIQRIEEDASQGIAPLEESPALNKLLLRNARKSINDISKVTGIPAGEVAERLSTLLDNTNYRDDLMEEKLLLAEIGMQVNDIRDRLNRMGMDDEAWMSGQRVQLAAIKTLLDQVDKRRKAVDGKLSVLNQQLAQLMGEAIRLAQERAVFNIEKKYPDLDPAIIYTEFEEALPKAIEYLENNARD